MSSRAELDETVRAVEAPGRRIVAAKADVRDAAALRAALDAGVAELGRLDIVWLPPGWKRSPTVSARSWPWPRMA